MLLDNPGSISELKDAFFSLQVNKRPGYDGISFNVVKHCFGSLHKPLLHIFNLSIQKGIFPDKLKIAKVTPAYKTMTKIFSKLKANLSSSMIFKNFGKSCL